MNKKGDIGIILGTLAVFSLFLLAGLGLFFATGWDTGLMTGTVIGYDTNAFGTKTVFVLEDRSVFRDGGGMSQSQIQLCSDYNDVEIHAAVERNIGKRVVIEYQERRVGLYSWKYCLEAPITAINRVES